MTNLTKSKERISEHGEVYTPTYIVQEMISLVSNRDWGDPSLICLEPTCGNGQFIEPLIKKKMEAGLSPEDACNTVFGLDILSDNVNECRQRVWDIVNPLVNGKKNKDRLRAILINNIVVANFIPFVKGGKWEAKKFFDKDPTGSGQVLPLKHQKEVLKAIATKGVLHD